MKTISRVKQIAHNTRRAMEKMADEQGYCSDLACMCAIASAELWRRLERAKIPARLVFCTENGSGGHIIVESGGYYIDITATQFSNQHQKVEIVPKNEFSRKGYWYWKTVKLFRTDTSLYQWQKRTDWPKDQLCIQEC